VIHRLQKSGHSLMSSHDPRMLVGLGKAEVIDRMIVYWPSGAVSILTHPALGRTHRVVEPRSEP
jgi:hypothetical protein